MSPDKTKFTNYSSSPNENKNKSNKQTGESFVKMNFQQSPNSRQRVNATPKTPDTFNSIDYRLFEEISIMMRASGDCNCNQQNRDAVLLVERIVIQQLKGIMNEVFNVAYKRTGSATEVSQCDFEFLMRNNRAKLMRFRKYMTNVQHAKSEQKRGFGMSFASRIAEDASDDEEIYDPERTRRLFRADRISQILNPIKYEEFQRARTFSSNVRNKADQSRKLVEILQIPKEIQDNVSFLDIILYLSQETVATLVDFSILTRLDSSNHVSDPFIISSSIANNMLHLCPEVTQGRGMDGIKAITVQEINEAIRRVQTTATKRMGTSFRSSEIKIPFLAL